MQSVGAGAAEVEGGRGWDQGPHACWKKWTWLARRPKWSCSTKYCCVAASVAGLVIMYHCMGFLRNQARPQHSHPEAAERRRGMSPAELHEGLI